MTRTVTLDAPIDRVWRCLVEPPRLGAWLGARVDLDVRTGGRVSVVDEDGERRGTVEDLAHGRRLALRLWSLPSPGCVPERNAGCVPEGSRIEFVVEDLGAKTRLTVTEERLTTALSSLAPASRPRGEPGVRSALVGVFGCG